MHKMHPFGDISGHFQFLLVSYLGNLLLFFVKDFEQGSSMAKLGNDDRLPFLSTCAHKQQQIWMTDMSQCFDFTLVLQAQLAIFDEVFDSQLFDGDISHFVLGLVHYRSSSRSDFLQVLDSAHVNVQKLSASECVIEELNGEVPLLIIGVWNPAVITFRLTVSFRLF